MIASSKGKANFVRLLLEHGADINTDDAVSSTDRQNEYRGKVCAMQSMRHAICFNWYTYT